MLWLELKRELPLKIRTTNISYLKIPPTPPTGISLWTFHERLRIGQPIAVSANQDGAASAASVRKVFAFAARPQHPSLTPGSPAGKSPNHFPQKYFHGLHFGFGNKFSTRGSDRCFLNPTVDKQRSHCWDMSSAGRKAAGWVVPAPGSVLALFESTTSVHRDPASHSSCGLFLLGMGEHLCCPAFWSSTMKIWSSHRCSLPSAWETDVFWLTGNSLTRKI